MQAIGLIETRGLIAAIESADAMLKAADVSLLDKTYVGGGLVSITVTGDVGAVKAAVDAGGAAVREMSGQLLISEHVIPRPHEDLECIIGLTPPPDDPELPTDPEPSAERVEDIISSDDAENVEDNDVEEPTVQVLAEEEKNASLEVDLDELSKEIIDQLFVEHSLEPVINLLSKLNVPKLRKLARDYTDFSIKGRMISKADKKKLLAEFNKYYGKK